MWYLLLANTTFAFERADTLRGSNGAGRNWWDVRHYRLDVSFDTANRSITGQVTIAASIIGTPSGRLQLDLQAPLVINKATLSWGIDQQKTDVSLLHEGNVWWVDYPFQLLPDSNFQLLICYSGQPRAAVNPPWDGGISWKKDSMGHDWVSVSCQGLGASVWWPCKDAQWDEPDEGADITLSYPGNLSCISNGRLVAPLVPSGGPSSWQWHVTNPINNYDITFYIGDYVHWHDTLMGEKGKLDLDYWVIRYQEPKARKQFEVVKQMLHCFEYWLGPYPFYEDGYKLVEAPYLGMEHQSAIAYGNQYLMGYKGRDRSLTGIGMAFDYIIVHESGHEWFGNSITAGDIADNWIHESLTTYSESLFAECLLGNTKAQEYCRGEWNGIRNDRPMIGPYGVNKEGSGDIYDKGAAIVHMIRTMTRDDQKFRLMLRGLNTEFYHKIVTTAQVEKYIAEKTGLELAPFFEQYLRTNNIPQLEYYVQNKVLHYRFQNIETGFTMPISAEIRKQKTITIYPTNTWQQIPWKGGRTVSFSKDYFIEVR